MSILHCDRCAAHVDTDWDTEFLQEFQGENRCPECRPEQLEDGMYTKPGIARPLYSLDGAYWFSTQTAALLSQGVIGQRTSK